MSLESLTGLINSLIPEPHAGLLNGIIFGAKATLDPALKNSLVTTGTLHIIALSGMNISILVTLVDALLLRILRRPIANLASIAIIIGFIWIVGPSPSVIRAGIMGGIALLSVALGRQNWPILAWILAVTTMLLLNPLWIGDLSFQLSVMATLGIILFGGKSPAFTGPAARTLQSDVLAKPFSRTSSSSAHINNFQQLFKSRLQWLRALDGRSSSRVTRGLTFFYMLISEDLRVTLAAQMFTVPIILFQFHRISLVSPLTNILIGWLIAPIMVLGFAVVTLGLVWMPLAQITAWAAWLLLQYVIIVIDMTAKLPFASVQW